MSHKSKTPTILYAPQRKFFPDPQQSMDDGLVAMADQMSVDILLEAYSFGIFPWPHEFMPVLWFSPDPRGVIDFSDLKINRTTRKFLNKTNFKVTFNQNFSQVIRECAKVPRREQDGTWIIPEIISAYEQFHEAGYAHSVECWDGNELVGGLYGVYVAGIFAGESMFFKKDNASKLCLLKLIEHLKSQGHTWIDVQMVTDNVKALGGKYISRNEYFQRLEQSKKIAKPIRL